MTQPLCYAGCGNPAEGTSAYCPSCAPGDTRSIHGGAFGCACCLEQFGTLRSFDRAQRVDYDKPQAVECIDPAGFGDLTRDANQVWQTSAGLRKRALGSERLWATREARNTP